MALVHCNFHSDVLEKDTGLYVALPEYQKLKRKERLRTLYLLHGLSDDYTKWVRRTPIERYARDSGFVIVMPDGEKGYYTNNLHGDRWWDFISGELPEFIKTMFPFISDRREDTYAAGLSMGGYGSIKLALSLPEHFCAAASFSGALNIQRELQDYPEFSGVYERVFGSLEMVKGTENDLFEAAEKVKKSKKPLPDLYISCGLQDDIYPQSQEFINWLTCLDIPFTYEEWDGGHDWIFWDESIRRALKWFLSCG
ncbi:alpha/beta hydrolase [Anaerostipes sp.]|uniref:alpha/beta hydrolase n=1 Tax=Anaerostipes sp. TaxID=1872530 RepID=UPI0025BBF773|nr:alpha/beta hydrolase family protein [Anaerostipes sp.]MBS7009117.1 esterase family protein [Anaerostipes sp.]